MGAPRALKTTIPLAFCCCSRLTPLVTHQETCITQDEPRDDRKFLIVDKSIKSHALDMKL